MKETERTLAAGAMYAAMVASQRMANHQQRLYRQIAEQGRRLKRQADHLADHVSTIVALRADATEQANRIAELEQQLAVREAEALAKMREFINGCRNRLECQPATWSVTPEDYRLLREIRDLLQPEPEATRDAT